VTANSNALILTSADGFKQTQRAPGKHTCTCRPSHQQSPVDALRASEVRVSRSNDELWLTGSVKGDCDEV